LKHNLGISLALAAMLMVPLMPQLARAEMPDHGASAKQCDMMGHGGTMGHGGMMGHGGIMGRGGMMSEMAALPVFLRSADLTPEQQTQVRKILHDNRSNMHDQFGKMHTAREQIAAKLFSTGAVTQSDLAPQTKEIAQAEQQMLENELSVALQVRKILTPEQLQKVVQFHEKFETLHHQMRALMKTQGPPPPPEAHPAM
jgi:Spy/CpxP family protein refolding chaperone